MGGENSTLLDEVNEARKFLMYIDDTKLINQLWYHVSRNSITVDFCEPGYQYKHLQAIEHTTQSNSQIIFADVLLKILGNQHETPAVIKMFLDPKYSKYDDSSSVEARIYMDVVSKLLEYNNTPNIIAPLAHVKCTGIIQKLIAASEDDKTVKTLEGSLDRLIDKAINQAYSNQDTSYVTELEELHKTGGIDTMQLLVLEQAVNAANLFEWLKDRKKFRISENDLVSVIFQVLYTLECFNRVKLRHNDLQQTNIFVQETSKKSVNMYLEYIVEGISYYIPSKLLALIYDFDRASTNTIKNEYVHKNYCKNFGQCNTDNPKFDTFKFLGGLKIYIVFRQEFSVLIEDFLFRVVSKELYNLQQKITSGKKNKLDGQMLLRYTDVMVELVETGDSEQAVKLLKKHIREETKLSADGDYTPPDTGPLWMKDTLTILGDPMFARFKVLPEGCEVLKTYTLPQKYTNGSKRVLDRFDDTRTTETYKQSKYWW